MEMVMGHPKFHVRGAAGILSRHEEQENGALQGSVIRTTFFLEALDDVIEFKERTVQRQNTRNDKKAGERLEEAVLEQQVLHERNLDGEIKESDLQETKRKHEMKTIENDRCSEVGDGRRLKKAGKSTSRILILGDHYATGFSEVLE
ncbi:hypothetical protein JTB14_036151 [Gonioctena quinquepunctata]|nr:hypothetical protein JTB14_036151 [Gonioctena quinquepunctata]